MEIPDIPSDMIGVAQPEDYRKRWDGKPVAVTQFHQSVAFVKLCAKHGLDHTDKGVAKFAATCMEKGRLDFIWCAESEARMARRGFTVPGTHKGFSSILHWMQKIVANTPQAA